MGAPNLEPQSASPARALALAVMAVQIRNDLDARTRDGLSPAETALLATLSRVHDDLQSIAEPAREEMGTAAVNILRTGEV